MYEISNLDSIFNLIQKLQEFNAQINSIMDTNSNNDIPICHIDKKSILNNMLKDIEDISGCFHQLKIDKSIKYYHFIPLLIELVELVNLYDNAQNTNIVKSFIRNLLQHLHDQFQISTNQLNQCSINNSSSYIPEQISKDHNDKFLRSLSIKSKSAFLKREKSLINQTEQCSISNSSSYIPEQISKDHRDNCSTNQSIKSRLIRSRSFENIIDPIFRKFNNKPSKSLNDISINKNVVNLLKLSNSLFNKNPEQYLEILPGEKYSDLKVIVSNLIIQMMNHIIQHHTNIDLHNYIEISTALHNSFIKNYHKTCHANQNSLEEIINTTNLNQLNQFNKSYSELLKIYLLQANGDTIPNLISFLTLLENEFTKNCWYYLVYDNNRIKSPNFIEIQHAILKILEEKLHFKQNETITQDLICSRINLLHSLNNLLINPLYKSNLVNYNFQKLIAKAINFLYKNHIYSNIKNNEIKILEISIKLKKLLYTEDITGIDSLIFKMMENFIYLFEHYFLKKDTSCLVYSFPTFLENKGYQENDLFNLINILRKFSIKNLKKNLHLQNIDNNVSIFKILSKLSIEFSYSLTTNPKIKNLLILLKALKKLPNFFAQNTTAEEEKNVLTLVEEVTNIASKKEEEFLTLLQKLIKNHLIGEFEQLTAQNFKKSDSMKIISYWINWIINPLNSRNTIQDTQNDRIILSINLDIIKLIDRCIKEINDQNILSTPQEKAVMLMKLTFYQQSISISSQIQERMDFSFQIQDIKKRMNTHSQQLKFVSEWKCEIPSATVIDIINIYGDMLINIPQFLHQEQFKQVREIISICIKNLNSCNKSNLKKLKRHKLEKTLKILEELYTYLEISLHNKSEIELLNTLNKILSISKTKLLINTIINLSTETQNSEEEITNHIEKLITTELDNKEVNKQKKITKYSDIVNQCTKYIFDKNMIKITNIVTKNFLLLIETIQKSDECVKTINILKTLSKLSLTKYSKSLNSINNATINNIIKTFIESLEQNTSHLDKLKFIQKFPLLELTNILAELVINSDQLLDKKHINVIKFWINSNIELLNVKQIYICASDLIKIIQNLSMLFINTTMIHDTTIINKYINQLYEMINTPEENIQNQVFDPNDNNPDINKLERILNYIKTIDDQATSDEIYILKEIILNIKHKSDINKLKIDTTKKTSDQKQVNLNFCFVPKEQKRSLTQKSKESSVTDDHLLTELQKFTKSILSLLKEITNNTKIDENWQFSSATDNDSSIKWKKSASRKKIQNDPIINENLQKIKKFHQKVEYAQQKGKEILPNSTLELIDLSIILNNYFKLLNKTNYNNKSEKDIKDIIDNDNTSFFFKPLFILTIQKLSDNPTILKQIAQHKLKNLNYTLQEVKNVFDACQQKTIIEPFIKKYCNTSDIDSNHNLDHLLNKNQYSRDTSSKDHFTYYDNTGYIDYYSHNLDHLLNKNQYLRDTPSKDHLTYYDNTGYIDYSSNNFDHLLSQNLCNDFITDPSE